MSNLLTNDQKKFLRIQIIMGGEIFGADSRCYGLVCLREIVGVSEEDLAIVFGITKHRVVKMINSYWKKVPRKILDVDYCK